MDRSSPHSALRVTENANGPVVLLAGDLDLQAAPQLRACLLDLTGQNVVLDFSDVTFIDSTAIGVLIAAHLRAEQSGGSVTLHGVQRAQRTLFRMTGLSECLVIDDEDVS